MKPGFSCDDAMECFFHLSSLETDAYRILVKDGPLTVKELGSHLNRDRSTAYRALKGLLSAGLVYKETKTIEQGGYYHVYAALDPAMVKSEMGNMIDQWYEKMKDALNKFDDYGS